ncbi:MAG: FAD-dependent oxidoreductase, partial [Anaerovoracaceae bacterium]
MKTYDAIIIGYGKGGKTMAGYLAKQGERVAIIERDPQMYGGTCINVGCIPSKSLVTSALGVKHSGPLSF